MSEDSSSESEISACSSKFDPLKALYSKTVKVPVSSAPIYETVRQFEDSLKKGNQIIPVGQHALVEKREQQKKLEKEKKLKALEEKNKNRFAKYEGAGLITRKRKKVNNVLTRIQSASGPLGTLKECVDTRLRIKVVTRNASGIRGELHGTLIAFDKQWNLALADVLEVWTRKVTNKRKIPPALGTPVAKGTAASISHVPLVTETPLGKGRLECTRHLPQVMVRGEHVVLINVVER